MDELSRKHRIIMIIITSIVVVSMLVSSFALLIANR